MKKKSKHKRKSKPTCPYEGKFGYGFNKLYECDYGLCDTFNKCKAAHDKLIGDKQPKKKSKQGKKHKKKQDHRGAYVPFPALGKLRRISYHYCVKLYLGYMEVGIIQETNKPWANNYYMAKRLGLGISTIITAKNLLIKGGFITIISGRGKQGHFGKHYIKLKYFPSKFVIEKQEYLHKLDEYIRGIDAWYDDVFMGTIDDLQKLEQKHKKLKRKYKKLKGAEK